MCALASLEDSSAAIVEVVRALVEVNPSIARAVDSIECTPLHYAAQAGLTEVAEVLVATAPDTAFYLDIEGDTPIELAVRFGCERTALLLLSIPGQDVEFLLHLFVAEAPHLIADLVALNQPLPPGCWELVPYATPRIASTMYDVFLRGTEHDMKQLISKLDTTDTSKITQTMLCLKHACPELPEPLIQHIVALSLDEFE